LDAFVLTEAERRFLTELDARGVRFLVVGLTAASLQGANTTTVDIDLWFEAADAAGGLYVSGFGMMPARLGGPLGDRLDVVTTITGLRAFSDEYADAPELTVEGVRLRVLPLHRIVASKRAANRPKDRAVIPALEEALAAIEDDET
jgi:hypothetical protein